MDICPQQNVEDGPSSSGQLHFQTTPLSSCSKSQRVITPDAFRDSPEDGKSKVDESNTAETPNESGNESSTSSDDSTKQLPKIDVSVVLIHSCIKNNVTFTVSTLLTFILLCFL